MSILLKRQLTDEEKQEILKQHGRKCFATGHQIPEGEPFQFDHIKAYGLGFPSELGNIAPMCSQPKRTLHGQSNTSVKPIAKMVS